MKKSLLEELPSIVKDDKVCSFVFKGRSTKKHKLRVFFEECHPKAEPLWACSVCASCDQDSVKDRGWPSKLGGGSRYQKWALLPWEQDTRGAGIQLAVACHSFSPHPYLSAASPHL